LTNLREFNINDNLFEGNTYKEYKLIEKQKNEIQELRNKFQVLEERFTILESKLLYQPDGPGYLEAKEDFENHSMN